MKILLFDLGSYTQKDIIYYLKKQGCTCRNLLYKIVDLYEDDFLERKFEENLKKDSYDFVMSTNFIPIIAKICARNNIKYLAWSYDSPINTDKIEYYQYPTSYIFLFDRIEVERVKNLGGVNIFHMPLAVNPDRLGTIHITKEDCLRYGADISFIGQFYKSPLEEIRPLLDQYQKGYIDALVETQLRIYGYNFLEEAITDDFTEKVNEQLRRQGVEIETIKKRGLIYAINKKITHMERLALLNLLGQSCKAKYYSSEKPESLSHLQYGGSAYYFTEMPKIFRLSKLNLNPTLKSIQSGIPLRALDILGCGGVLFSNYQPELAEYFNDGEDVIIYESIEDALVKADYYLRQDDLRQTIAQNGYQKAITHFSYPDKISQILKIAGIL